MCVTFIKDDTGVITITIGERFTFESHKEFRESYRNEPKNCEYIINMANTNYIDSSALGMLLLLRDHNGTESNIHITSCKTEVYKLFELTRFDVLFKFV